MKKRDRFRRYQLNKTSEAVLKSGHPWILTGNLSTAVSAFRDGDWMRLVSGKNETLGFGIFSSSGPIGIRIVQIGEFFSLERLEETVRKALELRKPLRSETNAYRILHGENDFLPGITLDRYGDTWVVQTYSRSLKAFSRLVQGIAYKIAPSAGEPVPKHILSLSPERRGKEEASPTRFLRGKRELPYFEKIRLLGLEWKTRLPGQKGGFFLDVRNLRRYILENPKLFENRECLHLFSHTGLTSVCLEYSKAKSVTSVDGGKEALEEFASFLSESPASFDEKNKIQVLGKHHLVRADLFRDWEFLESGKYGCIVLDPPNLAPNQASLPSAKKAYRSLISKALEHLEPGGDLILLSCSGRIRESEFEKIGRETLRAQGWNLGEWKRLDPEPDHPVRKEFPEGKYFKVHIYHNIRKIESPAK
nr:class I SAM-dependent methyltransferase [Leptospira wolffii]